MYVTVMVGWDGVLLYKTFKVEYEDKREEQYASLEQLLSDGWEYVDALGEVAWVERKCYPLVLIRRDGVRNVVKIPE